MRNKRAAAGVLLAVGVSGCATMRDNPTLCKVIATTTGAALGAVGGGVGTDKIGGDPDNGDVAAGAAAGFVGGGLIGAVLGHFLCPEPPPPPVAKPAPAPPAKGTRIASIPGANFDFNKATLKPEGRRKLDDAARVLKDNPSISVYVDGHTDSVGSDAYNQKLGQRRAQATADYLGTQGIGRSRLSVRSFGEQKPVASNASESGRAENRRVELIVQ